MSALKTTPKNQPMQLSGSYFQNSNNPFDHLGQLHNDAIFYYLDNMSYSGKNYDSLVLDICDKMSDYYEQVNPDEVSTDVKEYYKTQITSTLEGYTSGSLGDEIRSEFNSEYAQEISIQISHIVASDTNFHANKYTIIDSIKVKENLILSDTQLSGNERDALLRQAAITRYSIALWDYMLNNPNSEFINSNIEIDDLNNLPAPWFWNDWFGADIEIELSGRQAAVTAGVDGVVGVASGSVLGAAAGSFVTAVLLNITGWLD